MRKIVKIFDKLKLFLFGYRYLYVKNNYQKNHTLAVIYVLNDSLPEINNGYAIRSHHIASAVQINDIAIYPVTRLGFPFDSVIKPLYSSIIIDTVEYFRLYEKGYFQYNTPTSIFIRHYTSKLLQFSMDKKATIIHGVSNYVNGLASINVAKILNLPSIYEVRGFWELTEASRNPHFKNSISFQIQKKLEVQACMDATSVIALSEIVKEELIRRGIEKKKIYVVPNDVDTDKLKPITKNQTLLSQFGWEEKFVVGFIGSVVDYEGLHLLIKAAEKLQRSGNDTVRYLIVGDGNDLINLKSEVDKKSLSHLFTFTGRVPFEEVEQYYSIIDVVCYPRLNWEVCSIVSPKKPFEAMAYGIPIIASSIHANSYFIDDEETGLIHRSEDADDIANKIELLQKDGKFREKISANAREWVIQHRNTKSTGSLMKKIYIETLEKHDSSNRI
jgi:glycosyltransferase involved in cell wall biosynthesis